MIKKSRNYKKYTAIEKLTYDWDIIFAPMRINLREIFTGEKELMWQAKNRCTGETYGPIFKTIDECKNILIKLYTV